MRYVALIFWIIIIIFAITFASLNSHVIDINFYMKSVKVYIPLLLLFLLAVGALLGVLALLPALLKVKNNNRKLKSKVKRVEQEVKNLRSIPIKDSH